MQEYLYNLATDKKSGIFAGILKFFLLLLSLLYGLIIRIVLFGYRSNILKTTRLDCKVISVGNITLGGTGKTPLIELIAEFLVNKGLKIAILTRGYKSEQAQDKKPDEATMLAAKLPQVPILVGRNRIESARKAMKDYKSDLILLDDGFQHWRLHRDLDIVSIDATNPFGNRNMLPRGILREPLSSLKRADIFIITKADFGGANLDRIESLIKPIKPNAVVAQSTHSPIFLYSIENNKVIDASLMRDKNVCLLASIGDPATFEAMISKQGLNPLLKFYFLDHYQYKDSDLKKVVDSCKAQKINTIITTEKDLPRLKSLSLDFLNGFSVLALRIGIKFTKNEKIFFERLLSVCSR